MIGSLAPTLERQKGQANSVAHVNSLNVIFDEDHEFLETLVQYNINPELSKEELISCFKCHMRNASLSLTVPESSVKPISCR
jgi:hypothetical protein